MIQRIWHGWTAPDNADNYKILLKTEVFPSIERKKVKGYRQIDLLRRQDSDEIEFVTIMYFDYWQAVKDFAGDDFRRSYVPEKARELLVRHDVTSRRYEVKHVLKY
jgi:antibiotic biosynthesis monooxygenase (ABM) superfamily enzyme